MARHLVTGGAGFIGSHLTEALLDDGHHVTVVDDMSSGSRENIAPEYRQSPRLTIREADVTQRVPAAEFDVVTHLASIPSPPDYRAAPVETLRLGADATRRTLDLAAETDATYLFASTSEVYGDPEEHPQSEAYNGNVDPYGPRACYDESKRYGEALVRAYREQHDVDTRIARIFNTYGPRMADDRVVPTFVTQALDARPLTIHGSGEQTRSFCYVDDLVRGLRRLLDADVRVPVNLGNPEEVTINDLAATVCDVADVETHTIHTERPADDPQRRKPDITRAADLLGWEPTVSLREGLRKTVRAAAGPMPADV